MTEDEYYSRSLDDYRVLNSTINTGCDFNKYEPYVQKMRTLFVPSLERRIYSCLETFVYREDREPTTQPPHSRECLDVAATWREPLDVLSSGMGNYGLLERTMARAARYLIKDGLIDCFINSIILNNRLSKVCRNLDAIGVEKDFLRYLAVWNYINDKDYWLDDDRKTSLFMADPSYDSIESCSDLDVQVGSGLDTQRAGRSLKQTSKRRGVDYSSRVSHKNVKDLPKNGSKDDRSIPLFASRLSVDSSNPEGSKSSSVKRKPRSISQTYPCRPSNCPKYMRKISQRGNWQGKALKFRVCKICPSTINRSLARLSKLPLPCRFHAVISEIVKADPSVSGWSSIARKKLQAGVSKICRCVNETCGKMSREDVRRCRLHCEILPGSVSFKLVQRESNGCKVSLFTDRVATDKVDGHYTPREAPISEKPENIEQKRSQGFDLPIAESTRVDLAEQDSQIASSLRVEIKNEEDSRITSRLRSTEGKWDVNDQRNSHELVGDEASNRASGNGSNDQTCGCDPTFVDGLDFLNRKEERNPATAHVEDSEVTADRNNSTDTPGREECDHPSGNVVGDQTCYCSNSRSSKLEIFNCESKTIQETNHVDGCEASKPENLDTKLTTKDLSNRSSGDRLEDQTCLCSTSFPEKLEISQDTEKSEKSNCIECLDTSLEEFQATSTLKKSDTSTVIPNSRQISCMDNEKVENDQQVLMPQINLRNSCSQEKSPKREKKEFQCRDIVCDCHLDPCTCINKCNDEDDLEECHSQCSCDSCDAPDKSKSLNSLNDVTRDSSSANPAQPSQLDSRIPNPIRSILTDKSEYSGPTSQVQLQPNCLECHQDTSITSKISLKSNVPKSTFLDTEIKDIDPICGSPKCLQIQMDNPTSSGIEESKINSHSSACIDIGNDANELEECDSRCSCDSCGVPVRSSSVNHANPDQTPKINSRSANLVGPILIEKNRYSATARNAQQQPNCVESRAESWESHDPKMYQDASMKPKISKSKSNVTNPSFLDVETRNVDPNRESLKSLQIRTEKSTNSKIKDSSKRSSFLKSPIRIDTGRGSSPKSQRINISIELCPDSESSREETLRNERGMSSSSRRNVSIRSECVQDLSLMWKLKVQDHSAHDEASRSRAISQAGKNTKDECLRHLRGINACLHSRPRTLESRDHPPSIESASGMRNPNVYGMSTRSRVRSACKFEGRPRRQKKRGKDDDSRCPKFKEDRRRCDEVEMDKPAELPKGLPRKTTKSDRFPASVKHNNLCPAFSASSVDRMKHLIKTKLRRMLLERDKATNTPKTSLTNEKYRVSAPNGKTKYLPLVRQRCHTIWESRSASDADQSSRTFVSNGRTSFAGVSQDDQIETLFYSATNSKIVRSGHKNLETYRDSHGDNKSRCYCLRSSDQSVVSSQITTDTRLVGGSDAPQPKTVDQEFRCLRKQRRKSVIKITKNRTIEYVSDRRDDGLSSKSVKHSCTGDSEVVGDASAQLSPLVEGADGNEEEITDEYEDRIMKCPGKLDWSGNSTSRHIYLYDYGNFESSNEEEERRWCDGKITSPKFRSLPTCKQAQTEKRRTAGKSHRKSSKEVNSRACRRTDFGESANPRNTRDPNFLSPKIDVTSNVKSQKGFGKLDQDLRSKLLQYVSLCKNVKYSLLKMLRPDDVYEVSGASVPCLDRYKFGDS